MDVRSVDTTNLAAKRSEIEKIVPITQKLAIFTEDRLAPHSSAEVHQGNNKRPKLKKVLHKEKRSDDSFSLEGDESAQEYTNESSGTEEKYPGGTYGEHHILDIKV